jgi:transcriptional regulator with XRE-family HTH domain
MASNPYSSPLAFIGAELKRLRERAGMTQGDVAKGTNYALSTVSAYETGKLIPPSDFAKLADKLFGTDGHTEDDEGDLTRLQHLVEQVSVRPWFRDRVEVEKTAREIREYDAYQIPGLLETEDYARSGSTVVYIEGIFDAHYIRNRDSVELYELLFDHLRATALTDDKSLQLVKG